MAETMEKIPIDIIIILCSQLSAIGIATILPKNKYKKLYSRL